MRRFLFLAPYVVATVPAVVFAAPRTFLELANFLVTIMNNVVVVLVVLALVIFLYGISTSIYSVKDKGGEKLRVWIPWGILILFVMVSIWGILEILKNTFLSGGGSTPTGGSFDGGSGSFVPSFTE